MRFLISFEVKPVFIPMLFDLKVSNFILAQ